jgi:two-component system LytT family response regulator
MIRSIIVDDEPGSIITLHALLDTYCPDVQVVATSGNPLEAIDLVKEMNPDLLFLDIEMPFANAFDMLDMLKPVKFEVIFITAFNDYALKAFKYAVVDYLLKPINIAELKESVERVKKVLSGSPLFNQRVNGLLDNMRRPHDEPDVITVPTPKGFNVIELDQIIFMEANGSYSEISFVNGKKTMAIKSLKDFEEQLPSHMFMRIHHSYIVNMQKVEKYIRGRGGKVILTGGTSVEVATRKRNDFLEKLKNIRTNGSKPK